MLFESVVYFICIFYYFSFYIKSIGASSFLTFLLQTVNITLNRPLIYIRGNALWVQFMIDACAVQFTVSSRQKMASAKFLEEALSTDVDESAVNALVGSLETQLVTSTAAVSSQQGSSVTVNQNHINNAIANGNPVSSQKHSVTNGGSSSMNIILNSDASKINSAISTLQTSNVHSNVVNTVVASLHGVPASGYVNQVTSSGVNQSNLTNLAKAHEGVKIVYPSGTQTGSVNINNRVAFPAGSLPNGNLGLAPLPSHTVLNTVTSSVQNIVSQTHSQVNTSKGIGSVVSVEPGKQGITLVKASGTSVSQGTTLNAANVVTVPMTVNAAVSLAGNHVTANVGTTTAANMTGVVTLAKPLTQAVGSSQTIVGSPQTILPANVQILNVNAVRPGAPNQPGQKGLPQRVVIGAPHMVGARPGQAGQITLQTLHGLQPGTQGHLLLKTENGQFQLLRVGPAPSAPGATLTQSNTSTNLPNATAYRIQSVPAGAVTVATTTASAAAAAAVIQPTQPPALATQTVTAQRQTVDTTKEKCRKFLANLLELSSREPKSVERNVRTLIQELIDAKVEPEEFCDRLERLLNASPQPCLIGFLKKSLPLLRQSLITKELTIDGIRPPPHTVLFSLPNSATVVPQIQAQLRPPVSTANTTAQVRLMTPVTQNIGVTTIPRPAQTLPQHRIITPVRMQQPGPRILSNATVRQQTPVVSTATTAVSTTTTTTITTPIRVTLPTVPTPPLHIKPVMVQGKTTLVTTQMRPATPVHVRTQIGAQTKPSIITQSKPVISAIIPKPIIKEKEKKSFTSAAYTQDDDINDVAAMGGVNLAEETQRILGSTEFVGTQIRSVKDEVFLHSVPLQHKINKIVAKHGLEEPTSEVAALISHAVQERLKTLVEKLAVIAEHRMDFIKTDPRYEVVQDVKGQLKFLEELDRVERKRHEEQERELLLRAAKSRSKSEDPEQAKLKAKAKEMQRAEMEELRQREANLTALQAIGPRKKVKLDNPGPSGSSGESSMGTLNTINSTFNRSQLPLRPRLKRVNLRDLLFLLEQEKDTCRSSLLYKYYLK